MEGLRNILKGNNRSMLMALAILWVIAFHFAMYGNLLRYPLVDFIAGQGYLGVDVFFFLSAYGLCFSFNSNTPGEFYKRRFIKLYPVYLVFLAAYLLFFSKGLAISWWKFLLLQVSGLSSFSSLEIEWFIPALTILYLTFPLLYRLVEKVYGWGLAACSVLFLLSVAGGYLLSGSVLCLFPLRFPIIILGIMTYLAMRDDNLRFLCGIYVLAAVAGVLCTGLSRINVSLSGSLVVPLLLFGLGQTGLRAPDWKVMTFVGAHTLEIYLAQNLAFNHYMSSSPLPFVTNSLVSIGIVLAGSAILIVVQNLPKWIKACFQS